MTKTLIEHLASAIQARLNCVRSRNEEWYIKHTYSIGQLTAFLPSGSGIDHGTKVDLNKSTADRIILIAGFHHMDENGFYDGWTEHTITVRPSFIGDCDLTISGQNRNGIKEYLIDTYHYALSQMLVHDTEGFHHEKLPTDTV